MSDARAAFFARIARSRGETADRVVATDDDWRLPQPGLIRRPARAGPFETSPTARVDEPPASPTPLSQPHAVDVPPSPGRHSISAVGSDPVTNAISMDGLTKHYKDVHGPDRT